MHVTATVEQSQKKKQKRLICSFLNQSISTAMEQQLYLQKL